MHDIYRILVDSGRPLSTDTRTLEPGDVFLALVGENFDGNDFVPVALDEGARLVITMRTDITHSNIAWVKDTTTLLHQLAAYHRQQFTIPILAIAGSNGKTTTKDLVVTALEKKFAVVSTPKNNNNHIGVPLSVLEMNHKTQVGVFELGTNHPGELKVLVDIVQPTHGIVTNIGGEHLEHFQDVAGVLAEETELYGYLKRNHGTVFVHASDEILMKESEQIADRITYSIQLDSSADYLLEKKGQELCKGSMYIHFPLYGEHNAINAAAAYAIASHLSVSDTNILDAFSSFVPSSKRSEIIELSRGSFIYLDAYNANADSMKAALRAVQEIPGKHIVAILGDMFELGRHAFEQHKLVLEYAREANFFKSMFVGLLFSQHAAEYQKEDFMFFDTKEAFLKNIEYIAEADTVYLIKGSRGMTMETLVPEIQRVFQD